MYFSPILLIISSSIVTYCVYITVRIADFLAVAQNVDVTSQLLQERREMKVGRH